jgi:hypothetical protein
VGSKSGEGGVAPVLRYEDVCQDFLDAAEGTGLVVFGVHHLMDVISCDREFHCTCVAEESEPPYQIRAEINFPWEAFLTAESNFSEEYPAYRGIPVFNGQRVFPESFIELEVRIFFETNSFEDAGTLARRIQRLLSGLIIQERPQIKFEVSVSPESKVAVHDSYIYYCWKVAYSDEEVNFAPVCEELLRVMETLVNSSLFE